LLYVSSRRGELPTLPPPAQVVQVDGIGSIVVTATELPRSATNGNAAQVSQTMQLLGSAGLLGPIPR
jgi:hypothetical protein